MFRRSHSFLLYTRNSQRIAGYRSTEYYGLTNYGNCIGNIAIVDSVVRTRQTIFKITCNTNTRKTEVSIVRKKNKRRLYGVFAIHLRFVRPLRIRKCLFLWSSFDCIREMYTIDVSDDLLNVLIAVRFTTIMAEPRTRQRTGGPPFLVTLDAAAVFTFFVTPADVPR